jgi:hypothetical protein
MSLIPFPHFGGVLTFEKDTANACGPFDLRLVVCEFTYE